jgi:hypothetical protein
VNEQDLVALGHHAASRLNDLVLLLDGIGKQLFARGGQGKGTQFLKFLSPAAWQTACRAARGRIVDGYVAHQVGGAHVGFLPVDDQMELVAGGLELLHFNDLDGLIVDKKVHEQQ